MKSNHPNLSVNRQLNLLNIPHSSYFYVPQRNVQHTHFNEILKDNIMKIYMEKPFYGILRITAELNQLGYSVNHKHVARLHKDMKLETIYPHSRFHTSDSCPEHQKYPYLLKDMKIDHPNQVWSTDITYTKVNGNRTFVIAIVDWYSRKSLAYNVVNSMDTHHCIETLQQAVEKYGHPEIFNSDQGSQFTSREFTETLKKLGIRISMDGRGRCRDNARMERFWWSLKYEDLKIHDYVSLPQLRRGV